MIVSQITFANSRNFEIVLKAETIFQLSRLGVEALLKDMLQHFDTFIISLKLFVFWFRTLVLDFECSLLRI